MEFFRPLGVGVISGAFRVLHEYDYENLHVIWESQISGRVALDFSILHKLHFVLDFDKSVIRPSFRL